jgi:hypothetical protein
MKKLKGVLIYLVAFAIVALPAVSLAATCDAKGDEGELVCYISSFYYRLLIPIGTVLAGFVIMYAGITYAMSGGEPAKAQAAKEYIVGAITGLVLLLAAAMIIRTITS